MSETHQKGFTVNNSPFPKSPLCTALTALLIAVVTPALSIEIPDSPDGTVRVVAEELANRHPEVLWHALPPSYQTDITELAHGYAARMDPKVWNAFFGLGRKTVGLLRDKKTIILDSGLLESAGENRQQIEDGWDPMVGVLEGFFSSEVSRLEALRTINWERYLETTGRDLMTQAAEASKASGDDSFDRDFTQKLKKTKIEVVSLEGDQAAVRVSAPDEEPEDVQLTRVEGRWIPSDMAAEWDQNIDDAKQRLAGLSDEEIQQSSMQAMMVIGMIDGMLTELESVETSEQFEQAIQGILGPFLGGNMGDGFMSEPSTSDPAPGTTDS